MSHFIFSKHDEAICFQYDYYDYGIYCPKALICPKKAMSFFFNVNILTCKYFKMAGHI